MARRAERLIVMFIIQGTDKNGGILYVEEIFDRCSIRRKFFTARVGYNLANAEIFRELATAQNIINWLENPSARNFTIKTKDQIHG
jgi:hypothetical protein